MKRNGELRQRLIEHLLANDEVRKRAVKAIDAGLKEFQSAVAALDAARTADSTAGTVSRR